jgi:hypothetical protein
VGNKTLEWKVAKELQVGYRRWQKGGPQGGRLDESGRVVGGKEHLPGHRVARVMPPI